MVPIMKKALLCFSIIPLILTNSSVNASDTTSALGCIVNIATHEEYCLPVGERSEYSLPDWIVGQDIYVSAEAGAKVMLSDWDNLSYNRLAVFEGTVTHTQLKNVRAFNGQYLDFSRPRSMRVLSSNTPLGCIINMSTYEQYCLPPGERSEYRLPDWIAGQDVYVFAEPGTQVMLSDWDNLSYNRLATFEGYVAHDALKNVRAFNGQNLDFSRPRSMRVLYSN